MSAAEENNVDAIDSGTFELLFPSRFISFTFPNPNYHSNPNNPYSHLPLLQISVLDSSPSSDNNDNRGDDSGVAAMVVPIGRERDWIFSTFNGHLHLLLSARPCSRLILIALLDQPDPFSVSDPYKPYTRSLTDLDPDLVHRFQGDLLPLLLALSPRSCFKSGIPKVPFLSYDDDGVVSIVPVDYLVGPVAGEMVVEDVGIDRGGCRRRRLRFKRMPNLVQSQVNLLGDDNNVVEIGSLVQPYLGPMVAALSLLAEDHSGVPRHRALCVGVGGGALLMCLRCKFGFDVVGIEADDVVINAAKGHFGLVEDEFLKVVVGDGIGLLESRDLEGTFDVIMVDLDSGNILNGISAPPMEFVEKSVLLGARLSLGKKGIMAVNVIPDAVGSYYKRLVNCLREVFAELYEIDVGNGENYILVAAVSPVGSIGSGNKGPLFDRLRNVGVDRFVEYIEKI